MWRSSPVPTDCYYSKRERRRGKNQRRGNNVGLEAFTLFGSWYRSGKDPQNWVLARYRSSTWDIASGIPALASVPQKLLEGGLN